MRRWLCAIVVGVAVIVSTGLAAQVVQNRQVPGKIVMQKTRLKPGDPLPKRPARRPTDT